MYLNGLWTAEFTGNNGVVGAGTVVLLDGTLMGGDSGYYYTGAYRLVPGQFTANVRVIHYFGELSNIFGPLRTIDFVLTGAASEEWIIANGSAVGVFGATLSVRMRRITRLPSSGKP
jgi:hypothetical protein